MVYEVNDLARSVAFYRDVLGLEPGMAHEDMWAEFDAKPVTLALYCPKKMEQREASVGGAAVALAVPSVEEAVAELKSKGVEIAMDTMDTPVCRMAFVKDPDGNGIGLHQRKDGTFG